MADGNWGNPWKLTTIGLAVVVVTALVTEIVVAHRFGAREDRDVVAVATPPSRVATAPAPQPAVARTPQPVSSTPPRASVEACHQQAEQASQRDKTVEIVKDGASTQVFAGANTYTGNTILQQGTLVYLLALGVLLAGIGRLVSISQVGLPQPAAVWLGYLIPELLLPFVIVFAHRAGKRQGA